VIDVPDLTVQGTELVRRAREVSKVGELAERKHRRQRRGEGSLQTASSQVLEESRQHAASQSWSVIIVGVTWTSVNRVGCLA
jgi:hypothetical protein